MKALLMMTVLASMGCAKVSYDVKLDGCDDARAAVIYDAMQAWNDTCGAEIFEPSKDGFIRVMCTDKAYMYKTEDGKVVNGFYSPAGGYISLPIMSSPERYNLLVQHELGHVMGLYENRDGGHSDEKNSVMYWTTAFTNGITEVDKAEARRVGWSCK